MKKKYIMGAVLLAGLGIAVSGCSSSSDDSDSGSKSQTTTKKAEEKGFKGNTYTAENGSSITIDKITNVSVSDDDDNYTMVVVEGSFTNKSKSAVSPEDWIMDNLKIYQSFSNSESELDAPTADQEDNGTKWDSLFKASEDKVLSGKTVKFAQEYNLDKKSDKITSKYKIRAQRSDDGTEFGKALKITAGSDTFTHSDDIDTSSDDE